MKNRNELLKHPVGMPKNVGKRRQPSQLGGASGENSKKLHWTQLNWLTPDQETCKSKATGLRKLNTTEFNGVFNFNISVMHLSM